jgi:hypothetical protein
LQQGENINLIRYFKSYFRVSDLRIDGDSMALLENIANATGHLVEMHNYAMDTCKESTGSLGLLMLAEAIAFSHKKLTERAFSAIEDAKIRSRKSDANDDNIWPFFSNSLQMLERFGPWIKELDRLEEVFHEELKAIERFSSASMMNKVNKYSKITFLRIIRITKIHGISIFFDFALQKTLASCKDLLIRAFPNRPLFLLTRTQALRGLLNLQPMLLLILRLCQSDVLSNLWQTWIYGTRQRHHFLVFHSFLFCN